MSSSMRRVVLLLLLFTVEEFFSQPLVCEDHTIPYEFRASQEAQSSTSWNESSFIVIGTAGVRSASFESGDHCGSGHPTCNGIFRRETFYYGANQFTVETGIQISTLFFDHCYAENYLIKSFLSLFIQPHSTVTLFDGNCTKYSIPHRQFRLIIGDLSSEITLKVVELSRLLKAPQLAFGAASEWLDDEERYPLLLRYVPSTKYEAKYMLELAKRLDVSSLILFYPLTAYGIAGKQQLVAQAPSFGITIEQTHPVIRDNHANVNKTLKDLLENPSFISNSCVQMAFIGEESYFTPLVQGIIPVGREIDTQVWFDNNKRIITGVTWTPNYYIQQSKNVTTCLNEVKLAGDKNQYMLLKYSLSVGLPIDYNLLNNGLCEYLGDSTGSESLSKKCADKRTETRDPFLQNMYRAWWDVWSVVGRHNYQILHINQSHNLFDRLRMRKKGEGNFADVNYDIYEFNGDGTMEKNGSVEVRQDKMQGVFPYPSRSTCEMRRASLNSTPIEQHAQYTSITIGTFLLSLLNLTLVGCLIKSLRKPVQTMTNSPTEKWGCPTLGFNSSRTRSGLDMTLPSSTKTEDPDADRDRGVGNDALSVVESSNLSHTSLRSVATIRKRASMTQESLVSDIDPYRLPLQPPGFITPQSISSYPISILTSSHFEDQNRMPSHDGTPPIINVV